MHLVDFDRLVRCLSTCTCLQACAAHLKENKNFPQALAATLGAPDTGISRLQVHEAVQLIFDTVPPFHTVASWNLKTLKFQMFNSFQLISALQPRFSVVAPHLLVSRVFLAPAPEAEVRPAPPASRVQSEATESQNHIIACHMSLPPASNPALGSAIAVRKTKV